MKRTWSVWMVVALGGTVAGCGGSQAGGVSEQGANCLILQFKEDPTAVAACSASCQARDGESCTTLGTMYSRGHMVTADAAKALTLYVQGCDLGDAVGCFSAGKQHKTDGQAGKAVPYFERACGAQEGKITREDARDACFAAGDAYYSGEGVEKDPAKAGPLLKEACAKGKFEACDRFEWKPK